MAALVLCALVACESETVESDATQVTEREGGGARLLAVVALADGGNQAWAVDSRTGAAQPLFTTDPSYSMSEWQVSPAGDEVMYRLSHPLKEVRERLVVQPLAVGGEPVEVATSGGDEARLAGAAWDQPGVVFALQSGLGVEEGLGPEWTLMRWDRRRARQMWQLRPDPDSPRQLAGWDQSHATATLLDLPEHGGPARAVRYVEDGSEVGSVDVSAPSSGAVVSGDGTMTALVDSVSGRISVVKPGSRAPMSIGGGEGSPAHGPVWSRDDSVLAWTEQTSDSRWAMMWRPEGQNSGTGIGVEGVELPSNGRLVAVSGDRAMAAVTDDGKQLLVHQNGDSSWRPVEWEPPGSVWRVDWTSEPG
jgi:outer membrane protein assembly factor BamB